MSNPIVLEISGMRSLRAGCALRGGSRCRPIRPWSQLETQSCSRSRETVRFNAGKTPDQCLASPV